MFKFQQMKGPHAHKYLSKDLAPEGEQTTDSYHIDGNCPTAVWTGRGAAKRGLSGEITAASFKSECAKILGKAKTEKALAKRTVGYDCVCAPPQVVSAAYAVGDDDTRQAIWRAQARANAAVVDRLERTLETRSGAGGKIRTPGAELAVGTFFHDTNRAGEASIHGHNFALNTKGLNPKLLYSGAEQHALGAFFRAEMGRALAAEGFRVRATTGVDEKGKTYQSFDLPDVPRALMPALFQRSDEIKKEAEARGTSRYAENLRSRADKQHAERSELDARWLGQARAAGVTQRDFRRPNADPDTLLPAGELEKLDRAGADKATRDAYYAPEAKAARAAAFEAARAERSQRLAAGRASAARVNAAASAAGASLKAMLAKKKASTGGGGGGKDLDKLEHALERKYEGEPQG
jgi:conjugative relaxase-like TrwC/TraI family protein